MARFFNWDDDDDDDDDDSQTFTNMVRNHQCQPRHPFFGAKSASLVFGFS